AIPFGINSCLFLNFLVYFFIKMTAHDIFILLFLNLTIIFQPLLARHLKFTRPAEIPTMLSILIQSINHQVIMRIVSTILAATWTLRLAFYRKINVYSVACNSETCF